VIEGFQIEMTAQQLVAYLRRRADQHRDAAAECDLRREQAGWSASAPGAPDPERQLATVWPWWIDELDEDAARHRSRQAALLFLGEHVVADEVYRLDRSDLQFLEMWPRDRVEQRP
jgi:hypothetical protein